MNGYQKYFSSLEILLGYTIITLEAQYTDYHKCCSDKSSILSMFPGGLKTSKWAIEFESLERPTRRRFLSLLNSIRTYLESIYSLSQQVKQLTAWKRSYFSISILMNKEKKKIMYVFWKNIWRFLDVVYVN